MLHIPERDIRKHGRGHALAALWRQWRTERLLSRRGLHFRDTDPAQVASAYAAMTPDEFDGINARQDWANWRTIPRALSDNVPDRPLRVLDLGCGAGGSTQVLAFYAPSGSHITGYELAQPLLDMAVRRDYRQRDGTSVRVDFRRQGVAEPLLDATGAPLGAGTVDVVNASGVVGHHLTDATIAPLIAEIWRVLGPEGIAMLDVGPALGPESLMRLMSRAGFAARGRHRSWFGDPTGEIVFARCRDGKL